MLELWSAAGAFEALEAYLADELRPGLVADVYLGYGLSETLRRETKPAPTFGTWSMKLHCSQHAASETRFAIKTSSILWKRSFSDQSALSC